MNFKVEDLQIKIEDEEVKEEDQYFGKVNIYNIIILNDIWSYFPILKKECNILFLVLDVIRLNISLYERMMKEDLKMEKLLRRS